RSSSVCATVVADCHLLRSTRKGQYAMIQFTCPSCQVLLRVPREVAGRVARCPRCLADHRLPADEPDPESEAEVALIRACRARFGRPPRVLRAADVDACRLSLQPALEASFRKNNDPLLWILADQAALRDRGRVVWGHLVQANQLLFDPNNDDTAPANMMY